MAETKKSKKTSNESKKRLWIAWEIFCNVVLAVLYARFAYIFAVDFMETGRVSSGILLVFETITALFFLIRRRPNSFTQDPLEWFCAIAGTWLGLLLRPAEVVHDIPALQVIMIIGVLISMTGLLSLGRSFGIIPANRGVKTNGLYRFIRHPMYFGYIVMHICFIFQNFTTYNIGVFVGIVFFKVVRIVMEEDHLSKDKAYQELKKKVKYRLIPFVW